MFEHPITININLNSRDPKTEQVLGLIVGKLNTLLGIDASILNSERTIMSQLDDDKTELASLAADVATMKTNSDAVLAKLTELSTAGAGASDADLKDLLTQMQAVHATVTAVSQSDAAALNPPTDPNAQV